MDLSAPAGQSVNDGVRKELASLSYITVNDIVAEVLRKGMGTLLTKMDVKQAFRNIPVHPNNRHLLGMHWRGEVFMDMILPFGLWSALLLLRTPCNGQWKTGACHGFATT